MAEASQGRERVGRAAQEVGELLGQERRQFDARQILGRHQGGAGHGGHYELVGDAPPLRADHHLIDDHAQGGQRGGERVKEERRVLRGDPEPGAARPGGAVGQHFRVDLDRVEDRFLGGVGCHRPRHQFVHMPLGDLAPVTLQQRQHGPQLGGRLLGEPRGARRRYVANEAIDHPRPQLPASLGAVAGPRQGRAPRVDPQSAPHRTARRRTLLGSGCPVVACVGEGVALLDAQPQGAENAGDQRELVAVVEGDDRAGEPPEGGRLHRHGARQLGSKAMGGPHVLYKVRLGERVQVPFTEPREMLVHELGIDLGAADDDPSAQGQPGTARAVASVFLRFRSASSIPDCPQNV